jgi:serine/threonine protein kinase
MQCPVCQRQNNTAARFCAYCGAALDAGSDALGPGQLVDGGTYKIIRPLGKGGMGAVYLAANTKAFGRQCVVKEVIEYYDPTNAEERQKAIQRFETEARTLASLKHSGIPDIYAYFTEGGRNFLVMEYIEGEDLSGGLTREDDEGVIKGRPQPVEDVVSYAIQICDVLDYLETHQPPVIHNDIKPANIILDKNSKQAVLVDFGTAKTRYSRQAAGQPGRQQSSVYGTVGYAAAELYDGKGEPRSDVYALAATVYHLLTDDDPRSHPFQFPKMDEIPEPVREALLEALENDVKLRPGAAQFGRRLQQALDILHPRPGSARLVRPLTFPNGAQATTRQDLVSLSTKHWEYATDILYDGSVVRWLREALLDPAAVRAAEEAVKRYEDDPNAGLEYLIRSLDPQAMPSPQLNVVTGRLTYAQAEGEDDSQSILVSNTGGGYLYGTATSSAEWIKVDKRVRCAPGKQQSLPVKIDTQALTPGQTYRAKVDIQASGAQSASIPIEVRVPAPVVTISPMHIELVMTSRKELFTTRGEVEVRNRGRGRADCQIEGNPPWLFLDPQRFTCLTGQSRLVEMVGRADLLPAGDTAHRATLEVSIEGSLPQSVQVTVRTRQDTKRGSKLGTFVAIGCALLFLLGAVVFFLAMVGLLPIGL